jgi:ribonuclease P protein component
MSDEAHFSAQQPCPRPSPRLPLAHGDSGWPLGDSRPPCAWPQEAQRLIVIRRRADFLAANKGRRVPMPGFVLLVRPRGDGDEVMRVGFTVTKKIGGAVIRNRMKRRFRALARDLLPQNGIAGADHVLIGRDSGVERDFAALRSELEKALAKAKR